MSKIVNIGFLDVSEIKEDLAKEITEIANIGLLLESDNSQFLLRDCQKTNIGASIKIPKEIEVKVATINGEMKIDRDYLEGLMNPVILLVNGQLIFSEDLDRELINEKIYMMMVNGQLITPKNVSAIIQSKGQVNGNLIVYNNDYIYIDERVIFTNRFLKSLKPKSKLAINDLLIIDDIDLDLLKTKIENIQVLGKLIALEKYDECLSELVDEYFKVDLQLIPDGKGEVKCVEEDLKIDNTNIQKYNHTRLFVGGEVEIFLNSDINFHEFIEYIVCDKLICNIDTYNIIKDCLDKKVEVEIIKGKLLNNNTKLIISDRFEEKVTIKNNGKLIFEEGLDLDNFNDNVISISNFGVIEAPQDLLSIVRNKISENFGKIRASKNLGSLEEKKEDIMYSNTATLKL